jgi:hypothetical protein
MFGTIEKLYQIEKYFLLICRTLIRGYGWRINMIGIIVRATADLHSHFYLYFIMFIGIHSIVIAMVLR